MNPITAVWLGISTVGLFLSLYLCFESLLDLRAMKQHQAYANGRRLAARARLAREAVRAILHALYLWFGWRFLFVDFGFSTTILLLYLANVSFIINSILDLVWVRSGMLYTRRRTD